MVHPLFAPFRALGYICDDVPCAVQKLGKETFVTVSVGQSWQVYNCAKLKLVMVGPLVPSPIAALAAQHELTVAALQNGDIHIHKRADALRVLPYSAVADGAAANTIAHDRCGSAGATQQAEQGSAMGGSEQPLLLVLGDVLLVLYPTAGRLALWNFLLDDSQPQHILELPSDFHASCFCHPDTYLNKVAIGSTDGRIALWNFKTGTCIFESDALTGTAPDGGITCIQASPALDVVGVGMADGRVVLHNLKFDETVAEFTNASGVGLQQDMFLVGRAPSGALQAPPPVHAISFRTGPGLPLMAVGGHSGVITVWNLEQRRLHTVIKDAHDGPIRNLHFFAGEPVLLSQAGDNSLKEWIFDNADNSARLLRFRSGHAAPPVRVRGYGEDGKRLLSAGSDRAFRLFSTVQDHQSRELSQGRIQHKAKRFKVSQDELKLPPVTSLDACQVRERDWCNVLTGHEGTAAAYVWRLQNLCKGEAELKLPKEFAAKLPASVVKAPVTAVAISRCGNYGFVGSAAGRIDKYNMQSGLHRGDYSRGKVTPKGSATLVDLAAHEGPVSGVSCDSTNQLVLSCGRDGMLRCWDFKKRSLQYQLNTGAPCIALCFHPASCLTAVACEGAGASTLLGSRSTHSAAAAQLRVYDSSSQRLVRRFDMPCRPGVPVEEDVNSAATSGTDAVSDICISQDSRWLLAAGTDGLVAVWDIPTAQLQQVMDLGAPVTSLTLSPHMDLLTTTHRGERGLFLWTNQLLFGPADAMLPSSTPVSVRLPSVATGTHPEMVDEEHEQEGGAAESSPAATPAIVDAVYESGSGPCGPLPLAPKMVTMSMLPRTQWHSLAHLDAIKERSRPVEPPKKPEAAPFFLPTVPTLAGEPQFAVEATTAAVSDSDDDTTLPASRISRAKGSQAAAAPVSGFLAAVRAFGTGYADEDDAGQQHKLQQLLRYLRDMTPSALDLEIRAMQVIDVADPTDVKQQLQDLEYLIQFLLAATTQQLNFDFIQAVLQVVLKVHGETIMQHSHLRQLAAQLQSQVAASWGKVNAALQQVRCMASMFGGWPIA